MIVIIQLHKKLVSFCSVNIKYIYKWPWCKKYTGDSVFERKYHTNENTYVFKKFDLIIDVNCNNIWHADILFHVLMHYNTERSVRFLKFECAETIC